MISFLVPRPRLPWLASDHAPARQRRLKQVAAEAKICANAWQLLFVPWLNQKLEHRKPKKNTA